MGLPWISIFLILFSAGALFAVTSVPPATIGARFYRLVATTAMFLAATAVMSSGILAGRWDALRWTAVAYAGALALFAVLVRVPIAPTSRPVYLSLAAAGIALAFAGLPEGAVWGRLLACPTSAAAIGMALVAMLLGHSYLSSANLSFDLLIDACRLLIGALSIRGAVAVGFFLPEADVLSSWVSSDVVLVLLVGVRFAVGIACAIVLAWMALSCSKIRSNQSATGILYVALGFVVMGELVAAYLMTEKGLAL
jgi:hypothetical protein